VQRYWTHLNVHTPITGDFDVVAEAESFLAEAVRADDAALALA
jgi:hypothetical protein